MYRRAVISLQEHILVADTLTITTYAVVLSQTKLKITSSSTSHEFRQQQI